MMDRKTAKRALSGAYGQPRSRIMLWHELFNRLPPDGYCRLIEEFAPEDRAQLLRSIFLGKPPLSRGDCLALGLVF